MRTSDLRKLAVGQYVRNPINQLMGICHKILWTKNGLQVLVLSGRSSIILTPHNCTNWEITANPTTTTNPNATTNANPTNTNT